MTSKVDESLSSWGEDGRLWSALCGYSLALDHSTTAHAYSNCVLLCHVAGRPFFPSSWGENGRLWSALCGYERLPSELQDSTTMPGLDPSFRGIMRQVRLSLQPVILLFCYVA
jgi:hypothetical protein